MRKAHQQVFKNLSYKAGDKFFLTKAGCVDIGSGYFPGSQNMFAAQTRHGTHYRRVRDIAVQPEIFVNVTHGQPLPVGCYTFPDILHYISFQIAQNLAYSIPVSAENGYIRL